MEIQAGICILVFVILCGIGLTLLTRKKEPPMPTLKERISTDLLAAQKAYYDILLEEDTLLSRKGAAARRIERLQGDAGRLLDPYYVSRKLDLASHTHMGVVVGGAGGGGGSFSTGAPA